MASVVRASVVRALAILAFVVSASAQASVLSEWNLIVRNDLTSSSEVDGSTMVGGSLMGTSNYTVQMVTASNGDGLAIAGNIPAGAIANINNSGNLRTGGSVGGTVNLNGGTTIIDAGVSSMVASAFAEAEAISAALAGLPANGSMSGSGHFSATPQLLGSQQVAIYDIMDGDFDGLGQITLDFGTADTVIINVGADSNGMVNLVAPPNILSDFDQSHSSHILWNFYDSTDLVVNNSFNGAFLAPNADLQLLGGGINGSVVVDSVSQQNAEVRLNLFAPDAYILIPEPTSLAMLAVFGGTLVVRRRRAA